MQILSVERIDAIIAEAFRILEQIGVEVELPEAVELLSGAGARVSDAGGRVFIPEELCRRCLDTVPGEFQLYGRSGDTGLTIGGDATHFDPGSSALTLYDHTAREIRAATTRDVVEFAVLT